MSDAIEVLKERAEFDRARAETDLKILEKWKKNYLELEKQ